MFNKWIIQNDGMQDFIPSEIELENGTPIFLLTPNQLNSLDDGTPVYSIFGEKKTKGEDDIDMDIRAGYTAWGLLEPLGDVNV